MKAIIEVNVPDFQIDQEVSIYFKDTMMIKGIVQEPKTGHCKDCKWWKDSDGAFRRGIGAESQCPINRIEVYEGNGYCFMFKPQESEKV